MSIKTAAQQLARQAQAARIKQATGLWSKPLIGALAGAGIGGLGGYITDRMRDDDDETASTRSRWRNPLMGAITGGMAGLGIGGALSAASTMASPTTSEQEMTAKTDALIQQYGLKPAPPERDWGETAKALGTGTMRFLAPRNLAFGAGAALASKGWPKLKLWQASKHPEWITASSNDFVSKALRDAKNTTVNAFANAFENPETARKIIEHVRGGKTWMSPVTAEGIRNTTLAKGKDVSTMTSNTHNALQKAVSVKRPSTAGIPNFAQSVVDIANGGDATALLNRLNDELRRRQIYASGVRNKAYAADAQARVDEIKKLIQGVEGAKLHYASQPKLDNNSLNTAMRDALINDQGMLRAKLKMLNPADQGIRITNEGKPGNFRRIGVPLASTLLAMLAGRLTDSDPNEVKIRQVYDTLGENEIGRAALRRLGYEQPNP